MSGWESFQHKPTRVQAIPFTTATRDDVRRLLTAELGPGKFQMTDTYLHLETSQGDSRDILIGEGWVIKRRRHVRSRVPDIYPVDNEVMQDYERPPSGHRRRLLARRPR